LFPDAKTALHIHGLAHSVSAELGLRGKPLEADRLHVTLYYLGEFTAPRPDVVALAARAAASIATPLFDVKFNRLMSFERRRRLPLVLSSDAELVELESVHRALGAALFNGGFAPPADRQYTPHVTLLYADQGIAERSVEAVGWTAREFDLVRSVPGRPAYESLGRWKLALPIERR
jgi:RNA 2',3'-cyclic 3'-phosphodiesterase